MSPLKTAYLLGTNNLISDHQHGFGKARATGDLFAYAVQLYVKESFIKTTEYSLKAIDGTKVLLLNDQCLVSTIPLLHGLVVL